MTIATGAQALASDLLKAHNASGYLDLATSTELTISGGIVTQTQNWHRRHTEADASSDNLDTITAAASTTDGFLLVIRAENTARSIVIKHNTGNIYCPGATDITLDDVTSCVLMVYDATLVKWVVAASFQTTTGSGTGVADRVVLWASSTTLDSDANLTFDGTTLLLGSGQAITAGGAIRSNTSFNRSGTTGYLLVPTTPTALIDTSPSAWDGDARTTATYTFDLDDANNNLSASIRAVQLQVVAVWAAAADGNYVVVRQNGDTYPSITVRARVADITSENAGMVRVDASTKQFEVVVAGAATSATYIIMTGYYI